MYARSAAVFFKNLTEESGMDDVTTSLSKSFQWELTAKMVKADGELTQLEKQIKEKLDGKWDDLVRLAEASKEFENRRKAFILLYAHLLRLPVTNATLQKGWRVPSPLPELCMLIVFQPKLSYCSTRLSCSTPCLISLCRATGSYLLSRRCVFTRTSLKRSFLATRL